MGKRTGLTNIVGRLGDVGESSGGRHGELRDDGIVSWRSGRRRRRCEVVVGGEREEFGRGETRGVGEALIGWSLSGMARIR